MTANYRFGLRKWVAISALGAAILGQGLPAAAEGPACDPGAPGRGKPDFSALDRDGDGQLTVAEMLAMRAARFAEMDLNGDGSISADEMAELAAARAEQRAGKRFERLLKWRDADGDGVLSLAEISDNRGERMFLRMDVDGDGVVSAEEFEAAADRAGQRRKRPLARDGHSGPKGDGRGPRCGEDRDE